jgi:cellulose synthase/poly-beta-1,6-N-acetylglucosamine synthase-like glycosyltransferase
MNEVAFQFLRDARDKAGHSNPPLGQMLLEDGAITVAQLLKALTQHKRLQVPLGQVLVAEGMLSQSRLYDTLARQWDLPRADLRHSAPPRLASLGVEFCLEHTAFPEGFDNGVLKLAVSDRTAFEKAADALQDSFGLVVPSIASRSEILQAINRSFPQELAQSAAEKLPLQDSCRGLADAKTARYGVAAGLFLTLAAMLFLAPMALLTAASLGAIGLTFAATLLKALALFAGLKPDKNACAPDVRPDFLPVVSVMVPLHKEPEITQALIKRLSRLSYPKALLDVVLVIEENDLQTLAALAHAELPNWISVVSVPEGQPKTKPRALNHALQFCRGDIIGIYDAEDAPSPDQIERVVAAFDRAPMNVACVQGILQFYNPTQNWLARCFTMDYAAWFRVVLPGLARLGLPVPLGGTTLFLKRTAIEDLYGWDAHNVTEDADLGLRLHRRGYRTILMHSATDEEANCSVWPWIKQRSRWIKGYMVTYWTHMKTPVEHLKAVGLLPFLGLQVLFLGTILHMITAPILVSFWLGYLGLVNPVFTLGPDTLFRSVSIGLLLCEGVSMAIITLALIRADRRHLIPWVPTMSIYFLLAVPAGLKAAFEFITAPVYWDKTAHGHSLKKPD